MAEALFPDDPPPSYESQFEYCDNQRARMDSSPAPSAPPLRNNQPGQPHLQNRDHAPSPMTRQPYKRVPIQKPTEKIDLSKPPQKRAARKAPPPPPVSATSSTSNHYPYRRSNAQPIPKSSRSQSAYYSDISQDYGPDNRMSREDHRPLDSNYNRYRPHFSDSPCELSSGVSNSMFDISEPDSYVVEQGSVRRRPLSSIQPNEFQHPHVYESLQPRISPQDARSKYSQLKVLEEEPDSSQRRHQVPQTHLFSRQVSAPAIIPQHQQQRISLPPDYFSAVPENFSRTDSLNPPSGALTQSALSSHGNTIQPQLEDEIQSLTQTVFPQISPVQPEVLATLTHMQQPTPPQSTMERSLGSTQAPASTIVQQSPHTLVQQPPGPAAVQHSPPRHTLVQQSSPGPPLVQQLPPSGPALVQAAQAPPQQISLEGSPHVNSQLHPQGMEIVQKPQPKPRVSSQASNQVALASQNPSPPLSIQQQNLQFPQHAQQQVSTNQFLTTYPAGQAQLQTYTYAQQSSLINLPPGLIHHQMPRFGESPSPPFMNIPPSAFPPPHGPMSMQLAQQQPPPQQQQQQYSLQQSSSQQQQQQQFSSQDLQQQQQHSSPQHSQRQLSQSSSQHQSSQDSQQQLPSPDAPQYLPLHDTQQQRQHQQSSQDSPLHQQQTSTHDSSSQDSQQLGTSTQNEDSNVPDINGVQTIGEELHNATSLGTAATSQTQAGPSSHNGGSKRPVPKPRKVKKQSSILSVEVSDIDAPAPPSQVSQQDDGDSASAQERTPSEAPAKPPRQHASRKPAPPPPNHRRSDDKSAPTQPTLPPQNGIDQATAPTGYDIKDIFFNGNVVFLLPLSDPLRLPVRVSGKSVKGRGKYKNDCKFEVVFLSSAVGHEQTVHVIMLKSFSRTNYYLAISQKGKIRMTKGAADQCKFIVRQVTDRPLLKYGVVTLESAIHPGWSIAITSRGKTRNYKKSPESSSAKMDEIRFVVRAERIFNPYSSRLMSFERVSLLDQIRDRHVIQLESSVSKRYLCVTLAGRLGETGNKGDISTHFLIYDRGMGVVSLRSHKYPKLWLRWKEGTVQGKGRPDLAADFRVTETWGGSIRFESIIAPGLFLVSPSCEGSEDSQAGKNFIIKAVTK